MHNRLPARVFATALCLASALALSAPRAVGAEEGDVSASKKIDRTYEAIAKLSHDKKDDVITWFDNRIETITERFSELQDQSAQTAKELKRESAEHLDESRKMVSRRSAEAKQKLEVLKNASAESWDQAKRDMKRTLDRLEAALADAQATEEQG